MEPPPDWVSKCVLFLGYESDSELRIVGTGFFLAVPWTDNVEDGYGNYVVTARHLIEAVQEKSSTGEVALRCNRKGGGTSISRNHVSEWIMHPSPSVDIAILPVNVNDNDHTSIKLEAILTAKEISEYGIGPGENLIFPGLFVHHKGDAANIPILRQGSIAAMPIEKVQTSRYGAIEAYLVEARSIGGFSGSPVFVHFEGPRALRIGGSAWNHLRLIGLIHGHYDGDVEPDTIEDLIRIPGRNPSINMGIAISVPAEKIFEVVNLPEQVALRRHTLLSHQQKNEQARGRSD